jgi:hypothetical protein
MKKSILLLLGLASLTLHAQEPTEREVKTDVSEVTVYLENALETRKASVDVLPGKTQLKFTGLSPFVDAKSIQAKIDGDVTVLSVNHQQNFLNNPDESQKSKDLMVRIKDIEKKTEIESAYLHVIAEDIEFLKQNRDLGGTQSVTMAAVKEGADFFSARLTALKLKELERKATLADLNNELEKLYNQINSKNEEKIWATGEILVQVETKKATTLKAEISYIVSNASWFPSYDIRANNITDPLQIVYKANIRQDTKCDWKNAKLKLSSYNPTYSGVAPVLQTYFLGYNTRPPVYQAELSNVSGRVTDYNDEPLAGVSVKVKGTNVSTVTNLRGYYTLTLPANLRELEFSMLGYDKLVQRAYSGALNVVLNENEQALNEVSTTRTTISVASVQGADEEVGVDIADLEDHKVAIESKSAGKIRGTSSIPQQERIEKTISVDFDIKTPYTILSDNKVVTVDMDQLNLPVTYQYYAIPKLSKDVFLNAQVQDWEKYSLLEGEANVFFEDTYVGKTILNITTASDTLSISLGRDKKISINREKVKDYMTKQFIGNKSVEARDWKTTVRNNRSEKIMLVMLDQVPVSNNAEIEVSKETTPDSKFDAESGEISWESVINPGQSKVFDLKYTVKYPKNRRIYIE